MGAIEDMSMKIFNAYEDSYLEKEKRKIFEDIFDRYLAPVDTGGKMEPYDAALLLGRQHSDTFEEMVKALKDEGLLP
jgi:hypothetical protein